MGIGSKCRSVIYNKISLYISSTAVFPLDCLGQGTSIFPQENNIKWYHRFSSRELRMALPTFYRFRCLRKEAYDESLVVMVNYAVWMVVRGFIVDIINMQM